MHNPHIDWVNNYFLAWSLSCFYTFLYTQIVHFIMSLFLIAYTSPQNYEKLKFYKYFVIYRRILFTGKTLAPPSSSCSLPGLYIPMPKCMHIVCKWLTLITLLKKKKKKVLPAALYLALSLAVGHRRYIFFSQNSFTLQDCELLTAPHI